MQNYNLCEYPEAVLYLTELFDLLNEHYFESVFSNKKPVITIQGGTDSRSKSVWNNGVDERPEINVPAGSLNAPIEEVVAVMVHEMCHLYCALLKVQDTSRGGTYHNNRFKETAEARGLNVERDTLKGWATTTPKQELKDWCVSMELARINLYRYSSSYAVPHEAPEAEEETEEVAEPTPSRKTSSTRKLVCPNCRASVRATRDVKIMCGECFDGSNLATLFVLQEV